MSSCIYLFGPSCSGKSTLGKALQKFLPGDWTYIDRDNLIETGLCSDENADLFLETRIAQVRERVIIDAQIPWRKKREEELYVLLLPPLTALLERDALRTIRLQRPEEGALCAKAFVIQTHEQLSQRDKSEFDQCLDSDNLSLIEELIRLNNAITPQTSSQSRTGLRDITLIGIHLILLGVVLTIALFKTEKKS